MRAEVADHGAQRSRNEHADPVAEVPPGVKSAVWEAGQSLPVYLDKRTISEAVRTSQSGQERSFKEVESKLACHALSPLAASEAID
jgi:hypothetical protein